MRYFAHVLVYFCKTPQRLQGGGGCHRDALGRTALANFFVFFFWLAKGWQDAALGDPI